MDVDSAVSVLPDSPAGELGWPKIRSAKVKNDSVHPQTKNVLGFIEILPGKTKSNRPIMMSGNSHLGSWGGAG